jgi:beta-lactamase class A
LLSLIDATNDWRFERLSIMAIKQWLLYCLVFWSLVSGCSHGAPQTPISVAQTPDRRPQTNELVDLQSQLIQLAALAKGHVGVAAIILEAGTTAASLNPHDRFPMQSVYKLPIGMAVMKQVDEGKIKLDQKVSVRKADFVRAGQASPVRDKYPNGTELTVNELMAWMLKESDGTASDVLMKLAGGAAAVQMYLTDLPVPDLIVLNTEKELGRDSSAQYRNSATPDAAVALLRALYERRGLSETSQALLLKLMTKSTTGAKRLKGLLPAGTIVAHKTGTSGAEKGITGATNDIGIITLPNGQHLAIAVFVSDSAADEATREAVIAKIAKAVWDKFAAD